MATAETTNEPSSVKDAVDTGTIELLLPSKQLLFLILYF